MEPTGAKALVIMLDGRMVRQRGADLGLTPAEAAGEQVAWHELKSSGDLPGGADGPDAGRTGTDRGQVGGSLSGQALGVWSAGQAEAYRRGLGQAKAAYIMADGAVWLWNVQEDRFAQGLGLLDSSHASDYLWAVAEALYLTQAQRARSWVEPLLHQLRHG